MNTVLGEAVSEKITSLFSGQKEDAYSQIRPAMPPYGHQRRAVNNAVSGLTVHGFHALFMEMGTGKTKTTIDTWMVLVKQRISTCLVVVCPKSLMSTWTDEELPKHLTIDARIMTWDGKSSMKSNSAFLSFSEHPGPLVYVVNVEAFQSLNETLRQRMSTLLRNKATIMAIDESSTVKGPDAKRSKNIKAAAKLAVGRLILTGTEISKSPLDLYMQFEVLKDRFWGMKSFFMFKSRYAILEDAYGPGGRTFKKIVGYNKIDELTSMIAPYTTRAMKKDCLDLPEKIRSVIKVPMTAAQQKVYDELKAHLATILESGEVMTVANKISLFTKFRQITGGTMKNGEEYLVIDPKPGKLVALLDDLEDTDEQAIVWCAFRGEVQLVAEALSKLGRVVTFDGSTEIDERSVAKTDFQSGYARFFVANMKAGAFGLNLQNCHLQYFYSRDTSPQANWQAEDRSHRPGQKSVCVYKSLVVAGSVDERINDLISQSSDLLDKLRSAEGLEIFKYI